MKSLVPWPFRQTGRLKICAYCGLRASAFGFPWPAANAKFSISSKLFCCSCSCIEIND
ncbi:MAG: hypothetical protein GY821_14540 [Gammaproteobacteria bacterium]|nr:hypothetical protein [Gammaproteobacteria bacterium]